MGLKFPPVSALRQNMTATGSGNPGETGPLGGGCSVIVVQQVKSARDLGGTECGHTLYSDRGPAFV